MLSIVLNMSSLINSTYEQDFNLWREQTIEKIKQHNFHEVDWEHLIEELTDMGKSEKRAFSSNLMVLLAHLLKLKIQFDAPDTMKASWYNSVDEHRTRIKEDLIDNPSYKNSLEKTVQEVYKNSLKLAIKEGQRANFGVRKPSPSEYPSESPFSINQLLDEDFYGIESPNEL